MSDAERNLMHLHKVRSPGARLSAIREYVLNQPSTIPQETVRSILVQLLQTVLDAEPGSRAWDLERAIRQEMALLKTSRA